MSNEIERTQNPLQAKGPVKSSDHFDLSLLDEETRHEIEKTLQLGQVGLHIQAQKNVQEIQKLNATLGVHINKAYESEQHGLTSKSTHNEGPTKFTVEGRTSANNKNNIILAVIALIGIVAIIKAIG